MRFLRTPYEIVISACGGIIILLMVTRFSFDSYGLMYSCVSVYSESANTIDFKLFLSPKNLALM